MSKPVKIRRMEVDEAIEDNSKLGSLCLCHLPTEVLETILSYLSISDYFSLRAVSKCFRLTFSKWPVLVPENQKEIQLPFYLILKTETRRLINRDFPHEIQTHLCMTGKIRDLSSSRIYRNDIPDLNGTIVLLSKYGWLLLFRSEGYSRSSLFFFNSFSGAKIDLPFIYIIELCCPYFDISAPPTSPDCMVFLISCLNHGFEIRVCPRGQRHWNFNSYKRDDPRPDEERIYPYDPYFLNVLYPSGHVVNSIYEGGIWFCLHDNGSISSYNFTKRSWKFWPHANRERSRRQESFERQLDWCIFKDDVDMCVWVYRDVLFEVVLKEPVVYKRKFGDVHGLHSVQQIHEEIIMKLELDLLQGGSLNNTRWSVKLDSDDRNLSFMWLNKFDTLSRYINTGDHSTSISLSDPDCSTLIMWIQPVWFPPSDKLSWT